MLLEPETERERTIAIQRSSSTWNKAISILRRIAAGLPSRASRTKDRQFGRVANELLADVAQEAATKDRRAARREMRRDGRVRRRADLEMDSGLIVSVRVPRTRAARRRTD